MDNKIIQSLNDNITLINDGIDKYNKQIEEKEKAFADERTTTINNMKELVANADEKDFEKVQAPFNASMANLAEIKSNAQTFEKGEKKQIEKSISNLVEKKNALETALNMYSKIGNEKTGVVEETKVEEPVAVTPLVEPFIGPVEINATEENTTPVPTIAFEQPNVVSEPVNVVDEDPYVKQISA